MGFEKPRNCLLKYEDVKEGTLYSLTLNPAEQYHKKPDRQIHVISDLLKLFRSDKSCMGHVYVEISPHGRVHFHGVIGILDRWEFYLNLVPRIEDRYTIEIDTIKDENVWLKYCQKQQEYLPRPYRTGYGLAYKSPHVPDKDIPKYFQREESQAPQLD